MRLGVNIDHIASIRQLRFSIKPDPLEAAKICQRAGADSIVVHLREDRRHIQDKDVSLLRENIDAILNLEMSIAPQIVDIACRIKPDRSTLVPEKRQELTTEGGLDVYNNSESISKAVEKLQSKGIQVSLFIDPLKRQITSSRATGCECIELHTGKYADAKNKIQRQKYLGELKSAASLAKDMGLRVFAGHGLDYDNVKPIVKIPEIEELNIGYSIVCAAVFVGLAKAVSDMKNLLHP